MRNSPISIPVTTSYRPKNRRRILCAFPAYASSFGTFQHAYKLFPDVSAFMPPQGLLLIAAYLPPEWEVRFIDENRQPAGNEDLDWADAVLEEPARLKDGQVLIPDRPGIGMRWDEKAVKKYQL